MSVNSHQTRPLDLSRYSDAAPEQPLHLLFIHHSCGGQLLAALGTEKGTNCIYLTHPNGGGLRTRLEQNSYIVHEASYGSRLGENTDIFDWLPKFRSEMGEILACDSQDVRHTNDVRNNIVVFKSCFPNNDFKFEGRPPGNAAGPELTVWNARAAYAALLDEFRKRPEVLFVCVTAPPLVLKAPQPLWKLLAKKALGYGDCLIASARLAREFNNWLSGSDGWLKDSRLTNVVVFDYYDILTGHGVSDLSCHPTGDGHDSHPSREGNVKAAEAFVPFLNRAVRRCGIEPVNDKRQEHQSRNETCLTMKI
ncbi:MAG: hypothetical protein WBN75_04390 [Verrucomicrobiia bacterium]